MSNSVRIEDPLVWTVRVSQKAQGRVDVDPYNQHGKLRNGWTRDMYRQLTRWWEFSKRQRIKHIDIPKTPADIEYAVELCQQWCDQENSRVAALHDSVKGVIARFELKQSTVKELANPTN
jgi:hypothetical protein